MTSNTPIRASWALAFTALVLAGCSSPGTRGRLSQSAENQVDPGGLEQMIEPVSAPLTFESPTIQTSVRPLYLYHVFPSTSVFQGGRLRAYAAQLRWAITDDIAFIATQDGKAELSPGAGPEQSGSIDLEAGFKFKVHEDTEDNTLVTVGFTYQAANGDNDVFQGNGNGVWRPFVSAAKVTDALNIIGNVGANIPVDGGDESTSLDAHLHLSPSGDGAIVPLVEFHAIHYVSDGNATPFDFEGVDFANLGASDVDNQTIVTGAVGARWRAIESGSLGVTWETALSNREDIFQSRWTFDWLQRF